MLPLPESRVTRSVKVHNSDLHLFCDWVEGCLLFSGDVRLSRAEISDLLIRDLIYETESFSSEWLDNVWEELRRRRSLLPSPPFEVESRAILRVLRWEDVPAYAFCVLAPLLRYSKSWRPGKDDLAAYYAAQGSLFERISDEALRGAGWQTHLTGWSKTNSASLPTVVAGVAKAIGEPERSNWSANVSPIGNEAGLDVVLYRKFPDGRCGFPVYLAQCAAGKDWDTKLHTPVLSVWNELVDFSAKPRKAFTIPHSLDEQALRRATVKVKGPVFDRYRLHGKSLSSDWCSPGLERELIEFLRPLVASLPSAI